MQTLCQYYDSKVRELGYHSWNHFCAEAKGNVNVQWLKKQWKKEHKELKQYLDLKRGMRKDVFETALPMNGVPVPIPLGEENATKSI